MKLCLFLAVTAFVLAESAPAPAGLGSLEFDNLDTDLKDLKYEVEEEDLDDFSKLLDEAGDAEANKAKAKSTIKTSGFKKKNATNKGTKSKHNIDDLKKFFKTAGVHDQGEYDDDEVYALAAAFTGNAVGIKGNEDRKYKKGTKTRGFHRVHHKDEYKKDKLFYEDDEISGTIKKVGAKGFGKKLGAGARVDKGSFHHDRHKGIFGKQGYSDKGLSDKEFSDFSDAEGFDGTFSNESR